jgi:hypothetical protein
VIGSRHHVGRSRDQSGGDRGEQHGPSIGPVPSA